MTNIILLIMALAILLSLVIVLVVILKDGKFNFSIKKGKKKDVVSLQAQHQSQQDLNK